MPLRRFVDTSGTTWDVWEVAIPRPKLLLVDDGGAQVRRSIEPQIVRGGSWLCFDSFGDRRRLRPVPQAWHMLDAERLEALCAKATRVRLHSFPIDSRRSV